ncbi:tRNA1(Val) A37 N6-methylase TrmN6 [Hypnocyclicus thermotrophus]|uniref:tRNA1(Val) A37 N6-methylase TrmN6 n=1 Tax=Hypnocyclicus thermotrophus TaxID=1627895 RepID=A0AA46E071_9FUSO|nr:methyltransferase [Hypnocyclicus thermotrophus]TDT71916.1 tRNA1(Val) A37 N6-methylase TrmN6 [Hypnocyclicus thermotrophus]
MSFIENDETLDTLQKVNKKIIQKKKGFRFGVDAVLLANNIKIDKPSKILDIGTGTAIIPLLISNNKNIEYIDAIEIQDEIANMAKRSIEYNSLENLINIYNIDIKEFKKNKKYDIIITNPPYMKCETSNISSNIIKAISRHEIKLTLDNLLQSVREHLTLNGSFYLIYRTNRFYEVITKLENYKLYPKEIRFVYTKQNNKNSDLFILKSIKGKKGDFKVLEPLYIFDKKGEYSTEVKTYYY